MSSASSIRCWGGPSLAIEDVFSPARTIRLCQCCSTPKPASHDPSHDRLAMRAAWARNPDR